MSHFQEYHATVRLLLSDVSALDWIFPLIVLSIDVMDISGETQRDISHNIIKTRLTEAGDIVPNSHSAALQNEVEKMNNARADGYCGSCYGGMPPESGCCNSCDEVRQAYVNKGWSFGNPDSIDQVGEIWIRKNFPKKLTSRTTCSV